jgi:hypothetical protein
VANNKDIKFKGLRFELKARVAWPQTVDLF